jgi:hypothetical protein
MELVVESDIYSPSIDDKGNYVDKIPSFNNIKNGLRCPCGTRKDKTYDCTSYFSNHIKSKTHQKWLSDLNLNKANHYIENEKLKETLQNQRLIIARSEVEINNLRQTVTYLTMQLQKPVVSKNLLDFD